MVKTAGSALRLARASAKVKGRATVATAVAVKAHPGVLRATLQRHAAWQHATAIDVAARVNA